MPKTKPEVANVSGERAVDGEYQQSVVPVTLDRGIPIRAAGGIGHADGTDEEMSVCFAPAGVLEPFSLPTVLGTAFKRG
jgi:hypothetical protein